MSVPANAPAPNGQATVDPNGQTVSQEGAANPDASARPDSAVLETASEAQVSPERDWIREHFRPSVRTDAPNPDAKVEPAKETVSTDGKDTAAKPVTQPTTGTEPGAARMYSPDEIARMVQSEVDRREAKRASDVRQQQLQELRKKDPYKFIQALEEQEAQQVTETQLNERASAVVAQQVYEYDRRVLDQIVALAPDSEEKRVALSKVDGIEGRQNLTQAMLNLYTADVRAKALTEARKTLSEDQVFVKEILARYGGQRFEPEIVSAVAGGAQRVDPSAGMDDFIRGRGRVGPPL